MKTGPATRLRSDFQAAADAAVLDHRRQHIDHERTPIRDVMSEMSYGGDTSTDLHGDDPFLRDAVR